MLFNTIIDYYHDISKKNIKICIYKNTDFAIDATKSGYIANYELKIEDVNDGSLLNLLNN